MPLEQLVGAACLQEVGEIKGLLMDEMKEVVMMGEGGGSVGG